jgi:transcriptional regulator with XRE-family HTH domain
MGVKNLFNQEAFVKALNESRFSVQEVADMVGCRPNDIYRYKKGEATPRVSRLKKLVDILGPSITGLGVTTNGRPATQLTEDERRYLTWFRGLPPYRQARILGYTTAVYELGSEADAEFAAELAGELSVSESQTKEQPG